MEKINLGDQRPASLPSTLGSSCPVTGPGVGPLRLLQREEGWWSEAGGGRPAEEHSTHLGGRKVGPSSAHRNRNVRWWGG